MLSRMTSAPRPSVAFLISSTKSCSCVVDRDVGAELAAARQRSGSPRWRSPRPRAPSACADLDRHGADPAGAAVDQQRLAGPQPGDHAPGSTRPCRPPRAGRPRAPGRRRPVPAAPARPAPRPVRRSRRRPAARTPRRRPASRSRPAPSAAIRPGALQPEDRRRRPAAAGSGPGRCSRSARLTALAATSISTSPGARDRVGLLRTSTAGDPGCSTAPHALEGTTAHVRPTRVARSGRRSSPVGLVTRRCSGRSRVHGTLPAVTRPAQTWPNTGRSSGCGWPPRGWC